MGGTIRFLHPPFNDFARRLYATMICNTLLYNVLRIIIDNGRLLVTRDPNSVEFQYRANKQYALNLYYS